MTWVPVVCVCCACGREATITVLVPCTLHMIAEQCEQKLENRGWGIVDRDLGAMHGSFEKRYVCPDCMIFENADMMEG